MFEWLALAGLFAVVGGIGEVRRRARAKTLRRLLTEASLGTEQRAAAIEQLRQEVELCATAVPGAVRRGRLRRDASLRDARLALAEALLIDRPREALEQISYIALPSPAAGMPIGGDAWIWRLRLAACEAELALGNLDAGAAWIEAKELDPHGNPYPERLADLRAQIALQRGSPEDALKLLDQVVDPKSKRRRAITRARILAALGQDEPAAALLRGMDQKELERVQKRYASEPVAAVIAVLLLSGPYR